MKSIEDRADSDYGSRLLAALQKRGLSTSQWNRDTIQAMEKASRLEFLALFKKHEAHVSLSLIQAIRTASPEAVVDRLVIEKEARQQFMALIPTMFIGMM